MNPPKGAAPKKKPDGLKPSEPAAFWSLACSLVTFFIGMYYNVYTGPTALLPLIVSTGTLLLFEGLMRQPARKR